MRSRYTAHVLVHVEYLFETHDPRTRATLDPEGVRRWAEQTQWLGLTIVETEAGGPEDDHGVVTFAARHDAGDGPKLHHERSTFRKEAGRWVYVDGRPGRPPGRNAPCLCGSGKKFKRCCG